MNKPKFNIGDKVVINEIETFYKNRNVARNNEVFKRHYDYIKSKEPLEIHWVYAPEEIVYDEEYPNLSMVGKTNQKYLYNMHTPRSKMYLFYEDELEKYEEDK